MKIINDIPVWGDPLAEAVAQMEKIRAYERSPIFTALMADHHIGYYRTMKSLTAAAVFSIFLIIEIVNRNVDSTRIFLTVVALVINIVTFCLCCKR